MRSLVLAGMLAVFAFTANGQTSGFTYQGNLTDGVLAANGTYQMQFALFDAVTNGVQQGPTITNNSVMLAGGFFTVQLDFTVTPFIGGANRWLEISVKGPNDPGFVRLVPRQLLTASPYSIRTLSAAASDSLSSNCVGCVTNAQINSVDGSKVTGVVANSTNAVTAVNVSGVVPIANGGTGSSTKNFVDLSTAQAGIGGDKTFAGNVTVNGTLDATLGQSSTTTVSTAGLTLTSSGPFTLIPGLSQTLTVPANFVVLISTTGGIQTTSPLAAGFSRMDIIIAVDNFISSGATRRVLAANTTGAVFMAVNWDNTIALTLTPGVHTIAVFAAGAGGGTDATIAGDGSSALQGNLTVTLLRK